MNLMKLSYFSIDERTTVSIDGWNFWAEAVVKFYSWFDFHVEYITTWPYHQTEIMWVMRKPLPDKQTPYDPLHSKFVEEFHRFSDVMHVQTQTIFFSANKRNVSQPLL